MLYYMLKIYVILNCILYAIYPQFFLYVECHLLQVDFELEGKTKMGNRLENRLMMCICCHL